MEGPPGEAASVLYTTTGGLGWWVTKAHETVVYRMRGHQEIHQSPHNGSDSSARFAAVSISQKRLLRHSGG